MTLLFFFFFNSHSQPEGLKASALKTWSGEHGWFTGSKEEVKMGFSCSPGKAAVSGVKGTQIKQVSSGGCHSQIKKGTVVGRRC